MNNSSNRIRVLYCIEYLAHGGTEKQLMALIRGIDRCCFEPYLCCLRHSMIGLDFKKEALRLFEEMDCRKIQLDFISFRRFGWIKEVNSLARFINDNRINIIQAYFQDPSVFAVIAGKLTGTRHLIACFRDMIFWKARELHLKMWLIYKMCTGFIANSIAVKEAYIQEFGLQEKKFNVIYNGIELHAYDQFLRIGNSHKTKRTVGIVANMNREVKRVDIFLKAAAHVKKFQENVNFEIIGDGRLRDQLVLLAEDLGLADEVHFIGRVENVFDYIKQWDVGVISSDSEGFSNAILEYMIAGLPVVATNSGGNREIVQADFNGYLVPRGDFKEMGNRILELIKNDKLRFEMGNSARRIVSEKFKLSKNISEYQRYYESLIKNDI